MGKLHRIRKAFDKLPEARKRELYKSSGGRWSSVGCYFRETNTPYRNKGFHFDTTNYHRGYRNFIGKLCRDHFDGVAH